MNHTPITKDNPFDASLEWKRCLIWLAIQAKMYTDAAMLAIFNDMLADEHIVAYYQNFVEFRSEVRRITKTPEGWND